MDAIAIFCATDDFCQEFESCGRSSACWNPRQSRVGDEGSFVFVKS
ncbi:Transcription factor S-II (TFIIS) [Nitrosomonas sp. Nm58]|nr:Transcription factor S-II (TFIIS) [Nitrosomonas sp. Nm58]